MVVHMYTWIVDELHHHLSKPQVVLDGHSGWVRALSKHKKWLFSASCNKLRQYDMTRAVPSLVREVTLDKGDILSLVTGGDRIFAAGADGSIWCVGVMWGVDGCCAIIQLHHPITSSSSSSSSQVVGHHQVG